MIEISRNQANALVAGNHPVPAYLTINGIQQEYRVAKVETERSDFSLYGETPEMKFMAELEKVPSMFEIVLPLQPKKEKPLKYTELWMADTSNDMLDATMGYLTNGKVYDVLSSSFIQGRQQFEVVCDNGYVYYFHNGWFKPARLYDEDESELICRDIEFVEGDYVDLRKHTPEQIRHIAQYYKFYDVSELLDDGDYIFAVFDGIDFDGTDSYIRTKGKQYTYDDIFYSEGN